MAKSSFIERNKAVREAWNKEQQLVQEGNGTREWTPEQQKDILEKCRAYDDNGKAFEGQHMKSAEQYPEYQGVAGNIQFLTRAEHLEAHDGIWQNPTNWYFNPSTKEKLDFGDGPFIPCDVIQLADPVIKIQATREKEVAQETKKMEVENAKTKPQHTKPPSKSSNVDNAPKSGLGQQLKTGMKSFGKAIVEFPMKYPTATKVIKGLSIIVATVAVDTLVESVKGSSSGSGNEHSNSSRDYNDGGDVPDEPVDDYDDYSLDGDDSEYEESSYTPNDVPAGKQRYHYKDGSVKWKDKPSYHRGGNNNE